MSEFEGARVYGYDIGRGDQTSVVEARVVNGRLIVDRMVDIPRPLPDIIDLDRSDWREV